MLNKPYVPSKENTFTDFLSQKYETGKTTTNEPTTLKLISKDKNLNIVETRAQARHIMVPEPQIDLQAPEVPEEKEIVNPPIVDPPITFSQQQIIDGQQKDPTLDQTRQKVENQVYFSNYLQS
uniref:Uncharacterized protein n=1 Tax=Romanomermis culicivorax TaxID=13658 RepID=A0A915IVE9_ROMCU